MQAFKAAPTQAFTRRLVAWQESMDRQKLVILGAGLFAEEVSDLVSDCDQYELTAFGESSNGADAERGARSLRGYPILRLDELAALADTHLALCAIGTTRRSTFIASVENLGFRFAALLHPAARISRSAAVGPGAIVSAGAIIAGSATIGPHVIVNRGVLVGHHTTIGACATIGPGANIAGRVRIADGVFVGMGAIITDGVQIGAGAFISAAALVTKDVEACVQVAGVPAKVIRTNIAPH
jgi:sugar O-acyltransferase (sialic acid O-acetyltransferase NeuD family)